MNLLEPGLAFVEGLALIASPCILPVLPLVLSASVDGGRARPFGIITGFVLAFSLFALASRSIVQAFGIDVGIIKNVSLVLLLGFGFVLLSSKLSEKFARLTQGAANLGNKIGQPGKGGYGSGIVIGALIGLIWTPCAGPILAAVLVQVIRQTNGLDSLFVILSFAIGAGIPMLIIALAGRKVISKFSFFTTHAEELRKVFGVIILLSVVFIAFNAQIEGFFGGTPTEQASNTQAVKLEKALAKPYPAPEFAGLQGWINSPPLTIAQLKGKVVLVDFWTFSCVNCVRTLPYVTSWDKKYRDQGLVIVGIQSPEFEFEKSIDNVKKAVIQRGIHYPVALDNDLSTWQNFHNQYWPAHYLINRDGQVVYTHFGEGDYDVTENNIRYLLGLKTMAAADKTMPAETEADNQTPETYLGYNRAARYDGGRHVNDAVADYQYPATLAANHWALNGAWKVESEKITAAEANAGLRLNFTARKVFLVLGTATGRPLQVRIALNGKPAAPVTVSANTIYELIDQKTAKPGRLEITAGRPGLQAYAFTFGN